MFNLGMIEPTDSYVSSGNNSQLDSFVQAGIFLLELLLRFLAEGLPFFWSSPNAPRLELFHGPGVDLESTWSYPRKRVCTYHQVHVCQSSHVTIF